MRAHIEELISQALGYLKREGQLPADIDPAIEIEHTRDRSHGDYASNIAMVLAKPASMPPRELAEKLRQRLPTSKRVARVEVAGPGFLNFFASSHYLKVVLRDILAQGDRYGHAPEGSREDILIEFVSANPTGPLHVGHGRGAAYGASLANILRAAGHRVHREYYVNDHGRQMDILAVSVWLRYLELSGEKVGFPANGYRGDYIYEIAREVRERHGDDLRHPGMKVAEGLPEDAPEGDSEKHVDALIARAREMLGERGYEACFKAALESMVDDIREDLAAFGVDFERWFSERELESSGALARALEKLDKQGWLYQQDGATWFKATELGDDKDRVVVRENGRTTYFASDVAYLLDKLDRCSGTSLYVFGADHHGYVPRLKAAARGLDEDPDRLEFQLVQFAVLYRSGKKVQMSTRSGSFVTLRELREEVGNDAARYFYVMRSHEQHLDFDLDLAKSRANENPVYYIQYAHARIKSVFRELDSRGLRHNQAIGEVAVERLETDQEQELLRMVGRFPELIESAARQRAAHVIAHYLHELAAGFHSWYNATPFLVDDEDVRNARLNLVTAVGQVLRNGLDLIGVSAPEEM
ncbi:MULTISPECIES: arginine--tRNA ligase [unclassified Wenzhouxiangella]|uniref:arginine--tRNA ligase n=1 Tax=unclassified Wenzhouxiangella TaxID=2613841 RepID=UPI000E32504B|nr:MULTISPECIES: arginine--tRNA ligase [unclassified Wenzhouxiangella]RFF27395.1 arginine--tRNA ligase [Wenzhouxiangella sp. 15181]RFP68823.1 arginine--tRNA ligase [Wenzhouxiangella sp. 15190]